MKLIAPRISVDPEFGFGKPVIAGTRVPVSVVVGHIAAGDSSEEVQREYELMPDDVRAALSYAAKLVEEDVTRAVS
jgi:uncharacterized protein (DUF433 family)